MSQNIEKAIGEIGLAARTHGIASVVLAGLEDESELNRVREALSAGLSERSGSDGIQFSIAPDLLNSAESPIKIQEAEAAILVIRSGKVRAEDVRRASEQLAAHNKHPLGAIVIGAKHPVPGFVRRILGVT